MSGTAFPSHGGSSDGTPAAVVALPKFVHEHSKVLIETPIRIVVIILVALLLRR